MTRYTVNMASGHRWAFEADLAHAEAHLYLLSEEGERVHTPYRTADARHRPEDAAIILWELECGPDADPEDDAIASVTPD